MIYKIFQNKILDLKTLQTLQLKIKFSEYYLKSLYYVLVK
jgi:hypothetical protein